MSALRTKFPIDAVLTRAELAEWLQVPVATTYRLVGIPCRRVGREYRFPVAAVLRWLEGDDETAEFQAAAYNHRSMSTRSPRRGQVFAMPHRGGGGR